MPAPQEKYPATIDQKRLWMNWKLFPSSHAYNIGFEAEIKTDHFNLERYREAWETATDFFDSFRTYFVEDNNGEPVQVIVPPSVYNCDLVSFTDFTHLSNTDARNAVVDAKKKEVLTTPFELSRFPLFRNHVMRTAPDRYLLVHCCAHIISDGYSVPLYLKLVSSVFNNGKDAAMAPIRSKYVSMREYLDYVRQENEQSDHQQNLLASQQYWKETLNGANYLFDFKMPKRPEQEGAKRGRWIKFTLPAELTLRIFDLVKEKKTTLFCFLATAINVLLYRYFGQDDICVAYPVNNRPRAAKFECLAGYFVNTVILRTRVSGDDTFSQILQQVSAQRLRDRPHQLYPSLSEDVLAQIRKDEPKYFGPASNVMLAAAALCIKDFAIGDEGSSPFEQVGLEQVKSDLTFFYDAEPNRRGELELGIEYSSSIFDDQFASRMTTNFQVFLANVVQHTEEPIWRLRLISDDEKRLLTKDWNNTYVRYPYRYTTVHRMFEEQVQRTPNAVALSMLNADFTYLEEVTYAELNAQANQLAKVLLKKIQKYDSKIVAISVERSTKMIMAMIAILKAGLAFVPLDPKYPQERLQFMLEDTQAQLLLTECSLANLFPEDVLSVHMKEVLYIDADTMEQQLQLEDGTNIPADSSAHDRDLAYVIYTSGSTGKPKGVMLEHRGACNLAQAASQLLQIDNNSRVLQFASMSFDACVWEWCTTLTRGATLCMVSPKLVLIDQTLHDVLVRHSITTVTLPPSVLTTLSHLNPPSSLKTVVVAGEASSTQLLEKWSSHPRIRVINAYGPTETTVCATAFIYKPASKMGTNYHSGTTIGKPLPNLQCYVLDDRMQLAPAGVCGELYVGGVGLARGYLNCPELTRDRFVNNPFFDSNLPSSSEILYRTGDLVRYLPYGNLDYIGRIDTQVKVRGFRIELGEIESILKQYQGVTDAAVVVMLDETNEQKLLVAYIVAEQQTKFNERELKRDIRQYLQKSLPPHMIPNYLVFLPRLPLTVNGKIDRKALPSPYEVLSPSSKRRRPHHLNAQGSMTETERTILDVWRQVLYVSERDSLSFNDNFFDVGGSSLLVTQVFAKLPAEWKQDENAKITVIDLFQYPTISSLASHVDKLLEERSRTEKQKKLGAKPKLRGESSGAIAIIGVAGRFPGAADMDQFWDNLQGGVESISFYSKAELEAAGIPPSIISNPNYVPARGSISFEQVQGFDAGFFGYSPLEASITDPQQRVFLECAWEVLEDAGYDPKQFGGKIGIYGGVGYNSYLVDNLLPNHDLVQNVGTFRITLGNEKDFLCTRVSYKLDLQGPAVTVQTACSTSLVATHLACEALKNYDCDMAIAGGVSLGKNATKSAAGYLYEKGGILSSDGHCRAFDANTDGTVPGQGAAMVLLKRLEDAVADHDHIYAVIKGSAINNDGSLKAGYTAPNSQNQAEAIQAALDSAGFTADALDYIETHGTGTKLGDPIEIAALCHVFQGRAQACSCAIGSVKTNLGHLDTASGVAGLIKVSLALEHEKIPPSLNFAQPNPEANLENSPFVVNTTLRDWKRTSTSPRRAGISSFGIGGTNAHVIVEEAPVQHNSASRVTSTEWRHIVLSARSASALQKSIERLISHLGRHPDVDISNMAYTLQLGRRPFNHRCAVLCRSPTESIAALQRALADSKSQNPASSSSVSVDLNGESFSIVLSNSLSTLPEANRRPVVFMFPGQGTQYMYMGKRLYDEQPTYRAEVDRCLELIEKRFPPSAVITILREDLLALTEEVHQTCVTQPALFIMEYALAKMLMKDFGIQPAALLGHSIGEYTAACLAGIFSLEDALTLVVTRGWLLQTMVPKGGMVLISLPQDQVRTYLDQYPSLDLVVVNGPTRNIVGGPPEVIEKLKQQLNTEGVAFRHLNTSHAFHSRMVEPVLQPFTKVLATISMDQPNIPLLSNVTGTWMNAEQALDPSYWCQHLRGTVQFSNCLQTLLTDEKFKNGAIIVEVGPGSALKTLTKQHPMWQPIHHVVSTIPYNDKPQPVQDSLYALHAVSELWCHGAEIDWSKNYAHRPVCRVSLPTYPFERHRCWIDSPENRSDYAPSSPSPLPKPLGDEDGHPFTLKQQPSLPEPSTCPFTDTAALNRLERGIAAIWQKLLGGNIGDSLDRSLFDLGGDSLMVIQMVRYLEDAFQVPITADVIVKNPTIALLAKYIAQHSPSTPPPQGPSQDHGASTKPKDANGTTVRPKNSASLIRIQEGRPGMPPIFLVHPIGGESAFIYRDLVQQLGPDFPVYGFRALSLDGVIPPCKDIKTMASTYVAELLNVIRDRDDSSSPTTTFALGGSSFGGIVAYEMMQQLSRSFGIQVPLIVLIDAPAPEGLPAKLEEMAYILEYISHAYRYFGETVHITASELRHLSTPEAMVDYVLNKCSSTQDTSVNASRLNKEFLLNVLNTWISHQEAMNAYVPEPHQPISSYKALFFRHSEHTKEFPTDLHEPWQKLLCSSNSKSNDVMNPYGLRCQFRVLTVAGNHISMNSSPNVDIIAYCLSNALCQIAAARTETPNGSAHRRVRP